MNRIVTVIALSGMVFAGTPALAGDPPSQSPMSKRQMLVQVAGCMKRRMAADRNSSYNEALKACKEQIRKENNTLPGSPLVAADTAAER
jgi:hypothetical protein